MNVHFDRPRVCPDLQIPHFIARLSIMKVKVFTDRTLISVLREPVCLCADDTDLTVREFIISEREAPSQEGTAERGCVTTKVL